jgi:hypothetical protein
MNFFFSKIAKTTSLPSRHPWTRYSSSSSNGCRLPADPKHFPLKENERKAADGKQQLIMTFC